MKITVKTKNNETQSYSRRPCPEQGLIFRAAHFHIAGPIQSITTRIAQRIIQRVTDSPSRERAQPL
jgi:hypothetical protein